jgi:hypothetical protein
MPIVFSLIADSENNNLGAHPANNKVMTDTIITKILPKLPQDNHKRTLTQKEYDNIFLIYIVVSNSTTSIVEIMFISVSRKVAILNAYVGLSLTIWKPSSYK